MKIIKAVFALTFSFWGLTSVVMASDISRYSWTGTLGEKTKVSLWLETQSDGIAAGEITYLKRNSSIRVLGKCFDEDCKNYLLNEFLRLFGHPRG